MPVLLGDGLDRLGYDDFGGVYDGKEVDDVPSILGPSMIDVNDHSEENCYSEKPHPVVAILDCGRPCVDMRALVGRSRRRRWNINTVIVAISYRGVTRGAIHRGTRAHVHGS